MNNVVEVWLAVAAIGGKLGSAGDKLRMLLPPDGPPELKDAIRRHKAALLQLLTLNFLTVRSDALNATVFWTPDERTKEALVSAGADPGDIYTATELQELVGKRVSAAELPVIHAAKRRFSGRVSNG